MEKSTIPIKPILVAAMVGCWLAPAEAQLLSPGPASAPGESRQPSQIQAASPNLPSGADQLGSEKFPLVVKTIQTPKTATEAAEDAEERHQKSATDRWLVWFTGGLVIVGVLQLIVFGLQARRLRQTIQKMDEIASEQTKDMANSIAQATRAASAMEGVAGSMSINVKTTSEIAENQKEFWKMQMRAYLAITTGGYAAQDRNTGWKSEIRMFVQNNGLTPAHAVVVSSKARIMPFPLPNDIDLSLPVDKREAAGHIGPRQNFYFRSWLDRMLSDDELHEITQGNGEKLYIYGTIHYRDIFGIDRYTNFCQFCIWDIKGVLSTINVTRHNDAT